MAEPRDPVDGREVALGFAVGLLLHLAPVVVLVLASLPCAVGGDALGLLCGGLFGLAFGWWALIGIAQLVYIGPAVIWARKRGRGGLAKGLIIAAALTFVLNSACWGGFLWLTTRS